MKRLIKTVSLAIVFSLVLSCSLFASASSESISSYKVNEFGETYGNGLQANVIGYNADLMLAVGEYGVVGYVRSSDLDEPAPASPSEAVRVQCERIEKGFNGNYVPLYAKDGKTVVGRFWISFDVNDISNASKSDYAYGSEYGVSCSGYSFYIKSGIKKATGGVRGISCIRTTAATAPIGYMGAQARIIRYNDGALVRSTYWYYNETAVQSFSTDAFYATVTNNSFYSAGYTREFNTSISDYWTHATTNSPNVTA